MATTENRRARLEGCACSAYVNAPNGRGDCRRRPIPRASIDAINTLIGESSGVTKVVKTPRKFERRFESELNQPKQLLVPLAESAADLLCRGDFSRLKRCDNSKCAAFFYDTSKNGLRRWCSGTECGNRMRVAEFYARSRSDD